MRRIGARARDFGAVLVLVAWLLLIASRYFTADRGGFTEEAIPFRQALTLWGWGGAPATANPHFFSYPSLSIYAHAAAQWVAIQFGLWSGRYGTPADAGVEFVLDPGYLVVAARWLLGLVTLAGAVSMFLWWRARSRLLGLLAALGFCWCPLVVRSMLRMPPEVFLAPLVVLLVAVAAAENGDRRSRSVWTAVLAGLVLGTKLSAIPAAALCLAFASGLRRPDTTALRYFALAGMLALATFVVTTPFAVLDFRSFWQGTRFEWEHLASGHLLGSVEVSATAHGRQLFAALGYPLLAGMLVLPFVGRNLPARAWLALGVAATFVIPALGSATGGPDRYMLPAIPLLWLFTTEILHACASATGAARLISTAILSFAAIAQICVSAAALMVGKLEVPTAAASTWLRQHARSGDIIVQERGALALPSLANARELRASRCYAAASPAWQEVARSAPWFAVVTLPFVASGEIATVVATPQGQKFRVRAFAPSWKLVPAVYQSLDEIEVQYVARTQSISGRVTKIFPVLERPSASSTIFAGAMGRAREDADVTISPGPPRSASGRVLAGDWWENGAAFIVEVVDGEVNPSPSDNKNLLEAARRQVFQEWLEPYLTELAELNLARNDFEDAARAARLILLNDPDNLTAIRIAMLAMSGIDTPMPGEGVALVLDRSPGEAEADWLARALSEWRADPRIIRAELTRYLTWRRGSPSNRVP